MNVLVIGRGKVGRTLARGLVAGGVTARLAHGRGAARADAFDVIVVCVPDGRIREVAEVLAPSLSKRHVVLHCAGARGPLELAACRARGAAVSVFHPLASFASPLRADALSGATFVVHGDPRAVRAARGIARVLGGRTVALPALGPSYHAAAALVANGAAALAALGVDILIELGFTRRAAELALGHLLETVAANVKTVGVPRALTGPVVRGDAGTVRAHLDALAELSPQLAEAYARIQPVVLACARRAGLAEASARQIERVIARKRPGPRRAATATGNRRRRAPKSRARPRTKATRGRSRQERARTR